MYIEYNQLHNILIVQNKDPGEVETWIYVYLLVTNSLKINIYIMVSNFLWLVKSPSSERFGKHCTETAVQVQRRLLDSIECSSCETSGPSLGGIKLNLRPFFCSAIVFLCIHVHLCRSIKNNSCVLISLCTHTSWKHKKLVKFFTFFWASAWSSRSYSTIF